MHATADRLYRSALLMCGDHHLAEDLTQTTYAKVYAHWSKVSSADSPLAYSRTILTRTFLSHRRLRRSGEQPVDCPARTGRPRGLTWRCSVGPAGGAAAAPAPGPGGTGAALLGGPLRGADCRDPRHSESACRNRAAGRWPGSGPILPASHPDRQRDRGRSHDRPATAHARERGARDANMVRLAARARTRARHSAGAAASRPWRVGRRGRGHGSLLGRGGRAAARRPRRSWPDSVAGACRGRGRATSERADRCHRRCRPGGPGADRRARRPRAGGSRPTRGDASSGPSPEPARRCRRR